MKNKITAFVVFLLAAQIGFSQGFVNLNFEGANVTGYSPGAFLSLPASSGFPGWSPFFVSENIVNNQSTVSYDVLPLGSPAISIGDSYLTQYGLGPIQGLYSAFLFSVNGVNAGLSQSAVVPVGTESLLIYVRQATYPSGGSLAVAVGGQMITMTTVQQFSDYAVYGGSIAGFAGQLMPLSIMIVSGSDFGSSYGLEIDNIRFSGTPIPEPGTLALLGLGGLLLGLGHRRKRSVNGSFNPPAG